MPKSALSMIEPTAFYSRHSEKIKLNWFCYELALGIYDLMQQDLGRRLKKQSLNDEALADFSIYISKQMKEIILQKLAGRIDKVYFSYQVVEAYFPQLNDRLVDRILTTLSTTWKGLLDICVACPTRCITEHSAYCTMFDDDTI